MVNDDSVSMASSLSSRAAVVVARSASSSAGVIAGATVGAVAGAVLLLICCLPFILRARRRKAVRRQNANIATSETSDLAAGPLHKESFHYHPSPSPEQGHSFGIGKEHDVEAGAKPSGQESSLEESQQSTIPPGLYVQNSGIPSPSTVSPPPPPSAILDSLPAGAPTPFPSVPSPTSQPAGEVLGHDAALGLNPDGSAMPDAVNEGTEPATESAGGLHHRRRRSSNLSDSVRQLARRASAAIRRASTMSDGERSVILRSPSSATGPVLAPTVSAPPTFEPADVDARGEAYSYYHDVDSLPAPSGSYGPPLSIPTTGGPSPVHTGIYYSPTQMLGGTPTSTATPTVSPASNLVDRDNRELPDAGSAPLRKKSTFPKPVQRMDSLPLQAIMADLPGPLLPSKSEPSVNPMDIMQPSTETEVGWMVTQELVKLASPSPPAVDSRAPTVTEDPPAQPMSNPIHEPELMGVPRLEIDDLDAQDAQAGDHSVSSTPQPLSDISNYTTPNNTPDTRPTPSSDTPSPRSNYGGISKPDASSPRLFPCDECAQVFDHLHKLNHHKRYHERAHECPYQGCDRRFGTKTHLDRHINDKHENTKKYYCPHQTCRYSRRGGRAFPRKDNWRRHMLKTHNETNADPDSIDMDETMGGT